MRPRITRGPASHYAASQECIYEFGDGTSGGLISIGRTIDGKLTVDLYRLDPDVVVRAEASHVVTFHGRAS